MQCRAESCDRKSLVRGYCSMHYKRLRRSGDLLTVGGRRCARLTNEELQWRHARMTELAVRRRNLNIPVKVMAALMKYGYRNLCAVEAGTIHFGREIIYRYESAMRRYCIDQRLRMAQWGY